MKARIIVFPLKGRSWCFSKSCLPALRTSDSSLPPPTLRDLWTKISADRRAVSENAEVVVDFFSDTMNRAWSNLQKAPDGTFKNKIHSFGLWLLTRVKPSEIFLKSISKDITKVEVHYPESLNPRLVRRRLRHLAVRGSIIHKRNFYGSFTLLPFTAVLAVLPLPNIPFFWILFRTYSNWKAFKGSERLLLLLSDCSKAWTSIAAHEKGRVASIDDSNAVKYLPGPPWVMQPSEELEKLLSTQDVKECVSNCIVLDICKQYNLNDKEVLKYKDVL